MIAVEYTKGTPEGVPPAGRRTRVASRIAKNPIGLPSHNGAHHER